MCSRDEKAVRSPHVRSLLAFRDCPGHTNIFQGIGEGILKKVLTLFQHFQDGCFKQCFELFIFDE